MPGLDRKHTKQNLLDETPSQVLPHCELFPRETHGQILDPVEERNQTGLYFIIDRLISWTRTGCEA